jgi:hypothetical protein
MGCKQFRIKPDEPVDKSEPRKSLPTTSNTGIVQILSDEPNKSKACPVVVYRNPLSTSKPLVVMSVISNGPDEFTQHIQPIISRTPVKSNKSDEYHNSETYSNSGQPTSHNNMDSDMSDILENSNTTATSDDSNGSYSVYRRASSSSIDQENIAHRKDALNRLISARPNRLQTRQESTRNNMWSESGEGYSFSDSMASAASADSEGSAAIGSKGAKAIFFQPKQSNLQQKPFTNETSSGSDVSELHYETGGNPAFSEVRVMTEHLKTVLRSTSTKLSSSDYHHRGVFSETASEAEEF